MKIGVIISMLVYTVSGVATYIYELVRHLRILIKEKDYLSGMATDLFVTHQHKAKAKTMLARVAWLNMVNWERIVFRHPRRLFVSPTFLNIYFRGEGIFQVG